MQISIKIPLHSLGEKALGASNSKSCLTIKIITKTIVGYIDKSTEYIFP